MDFLGEGFYSICSHFSIGEFISFARSGEFSATFLQTLFQSHSCTSSGTPVVHILHLCFVYRSLNLSSFFQLDLCLFKLGKFSWSVLMFIDFILGHLQSTLSLSSGFFVSIIDFFHSIILI